MDKTCRFPGCTAPTGFEDVCPQHLEQDAVKIMTCRCPCHTEDGLLKGEDHLLGCQVMILTDRNLSQALVEIDRAFGAAIGTPEGNRLEDLVHAVAEFENRLPSEVTDLNMLALLRALDQASMGRDHYKRKWLDLHNQIRDATPDER